MAEKRNASGREFEDHLRQVRDTSVAEVPQFEVLSTDGRQVFGLTHALLGYNLQQMRADQRTMETVRDNTGQLVHPPERILLTPPASALENNFGPFGQNVRQLSDEFRRSEQGQATRDLADTIQLDSLSYDSFHRQLRVLFEQGFSIEAFVALFEFLARLLIRCYAERGFKVFVEMSHDLLRWFLAYVLTELVRFAANYIRSLSAAERASFLRGFAAGSGATIGVLLFGFLMYKRLQH